NSFDSFPYSTLFRSQRSDVRPEGCLQQLLCQGRVVVVLRGSQGRAVDEQSLRVSASDGLRRLDQVLERGFEVVALVDHVRQARQDRKSTRLNSSHVQ